MTSASSPDGEPESSEWYVGTDDLGKPFGWTDDGEVFAVYYDKKKGGYMPLTRKRWLRKNATEWLQVIGGFAALVAWAFAIGALNHDHHPGWATLLLAAPIFYLLGRYHQSRK